MKRSSAFRPSWTPLESRWLPAVGAYPDAARNALQASYVAQADTKANDLVFLGDSITQYWGNAASQSGGNATWNADFAKLGAANFGIAGDTTQNLLYRINNGVLDGQPRVVVLLVGNNDLARGDSAEQTASGIASVVRAIHSTSPASKILLLGVLPTDLPFLNANIPQVNALISGLAAESYVTYQDPGALFEQADGSANPGLLKDVVHPNAAGYQVLANAIDETILGLLGEPTTPPKPQALKTFATPLSPTQVDAATASPDLAFIPYLVNIEAPTPAPVARSTAPGQREPFSAELVAITRT